MDSLIWASRQDHQLLVDVLGTVSATRELFPSRGLHILRCHCTYINESSYLASVLVRWLRFLQDALDRFVVGQHVNHKGTG